MGGFPRPDVAPIRVDDLLAALDTGYAIVGDETVAVTGVSLDSRAVHPGDLYAALPGHRTHGAHYARQALSSGAHAVLTDSAGLAILEAEGVDCPSIVVVEQPRLLLGHVSSMTYGTAGAGQVILGVTGTNGKTTVASMVAAGLRAAGRCVGVIGTIGVTVGDQVHPGSRTTPEAPDLHSLLAHMRQRGVDSVSMEVSSIAVDEHRVDGLVLDVIGFTNLTQDHLDYHGSMEAYYLAKAALFTPVHARRGVVGIDDEWGARLARESGIETVTWSLRDATADWYCDPAPTSTATGRIAIGPGGVRIPLDIALPGSFNVSNALCALAMLVSAGIDPSIAADGIGQVRVPGRMQVVGTAGAVTGIVDYAHTPDAVERAIAAARESYRGRIIVVLGAGGDRDRSKRPQMGQIAARDADVVVVTDDNPRSEDPGAIRAEVLAGTELVDSARRAGVVEVGDRRQAITVAVQGASEGDVVLVLGKGHEQGQEVMGVVSAFDDASVLSRALGLDPPSAGGAA